VTLQEQFGQIDIYLFDQILRGNITPAMRVLDAGSGLGRNLVYLLRQGCEVFAVDKNEHAVEYVRSLAGSLGNSSPAKNFRIAPAERMPGRLPREWRRQVKGTSGPRLCKSKSREKHRCPGRARESAPRSNQDVPLRICGLSAVGSCPKAEPYIHLRPWAPKEPSPKIEFVFSASPETIRGEPPEFDLLRTVAYLQDLPVCAPSHPDAFSFLGRFRLPPCLQGFRQARSPVFCVPPRGSSKPVSWPQPGWHGFNCPSASPFRGAGPVPS